MAAEDQILIAEDQQILVAEDNGLATEVQQVVATEGAAEVLAPEDSPEYKHVDVEETVPADIMQDLAREEDPGLQAIQVLYQEETLGHQAAQDLAREKDPGLQAVQVLTKEEPPGIQALLLMMLCAVRTCSHH